MSTRSVIGILRADDTIEAIYCHYDGYFDWTGRILEDHWRDPNRIDMLLAGGGLSQLNKTLGKKHDSNWKQAYRVAKFADEDARDAAIEADQRSGWCIFMKRDHGEKGFDATTYASLDDLAADFEEYLYLWDEVTGYWLGARTFGRGADELVWYRLSDLKATDWKTEDDNDDPIASLPTTSFSREHRAGASEQSVATPRQVEPKGMARNPEYATF